MTEPATGFVDEMRASGHPVSEWSNAAGFTYAPHSHGYRKVLCCLEGSIVFHLPDGDVQLSRGERMDLRAGIVHSATVGPAGVCCAEVHIS